MNIDINTKFIPLLGTPLDKSYAAQMQNAAYRAMGLNLIYYYIETGKEHLPALVQALRYMPVKGFAVTKPNKVEVLKYLDELDPLCQKLGACNTVVKGEDGRLTGYNTDCTGFYTSITRDGGIEIEGGCFFCFGAGGAARAICCTLAEHGAERIYITSRGFNSAKLLSEDINRRFSPCAVAVEPGQYPRYIKDCAVVINASGLGMSGSEEQSPMEKEYMLPGGLYFDACYNPGKTRFLSEAEARGCRILNGLNMSLYQGAEQIWLWTGMEAPIELMERTLKDIISR